MNEDEFILEDSILDFLLYNNRIHTTVTREKYPSPPPRRGDTFHEFTTRENCPSSPKFDV